MNLKRDTEQTDARRWPGVPRLSELVRDVFAGARSQIVASVTLMLVLATVCFAILVTTGQSAANEARIVDQIDSAGTRLIALSDSGGESGILPQAPAVLGSLSDAEWAFGLGAAMDVTNPALPAQRAAARVMIGALPPDLTLVQGRHPRAGEAVVGSGVVGALNLRPELGRIQYDNDPGAEPLAVVGVFEATGPLAQLDDTVLISSAPEDIETLRYVYVMARDITVVDRLEQLVTTATPAMNPNALTVETPQGAIALRDVIAGRLGAASRQLMAVVMGVGAAIIAVTMVSATSARRRDFGRRRALGASRSVLVATMLGQAAIGALAGIALGIVAGLSVLAATTGSLPTWQFTAGVAGLTLLLTLATSAPISTFAAHRDPLRILRVP